MKKVWFVFLLAIFIVSACGAESNLSVKEDVIATVPSSYLGLTNPLDSSVATDGERIFQTNCSSCHGSSGHGDGPAASALNPAPKNLSELQLQVSDGYLFWRISEGSPGTAMVAWRGILTDEQIWQIITFIRTLE